MNVECRKEGKTCESSTDSTPRPKKETTPEGLQGVVSRLFVNVPHILESNAVLACGICQLSASLTEVFCLFKSQKVQNFMLISYSFFEQEIRGITMQLMLLLALAFNSIAFADLDCGSIPSLENEVRVRTSYAEYAQLYHQNLFEISKDARGLNIKAATIGISSGLILIGGGAAIVFIGDGALYGAGVVAKTYFGLKVIPGFLGAFGGAAIIEGIGLSGTAANLIFSLVVSAAANVESVLYVGNGVYQIVKGHDVLTIDLKEISQSETKIADYLALLRKDISNRIASPPSEIWNAVSMGGLNADHYATIAERSELHARLHFDLLNISKAKLSMVKKACAQ